MSKKALIFSLAYHPRFVGGAEVAVREITNRIAPEKISFDMVTLRFDTTLPRYEQIGNVRVYRVGFGKKNPGIDELSSFPLSLNKYLFPFIGFVKALSLNRKEKYDYIWAIMANYAGFAALFFKILHPKTFYILTLQEGDPLHYIKRRVRFVRPIFEHIFKKADVVQAISNHLKKFAKDMGARCLVHTIPNGVDVKKFRIKSEELRIKNEKRKEKILITTSRLVKKNGIDDVIKSLQYFPSRVHFHIIGIGPELNNLKNLTNSLGFNDRVHFLGYKNHKDLPGYLYGADVFVRPSLSEGLGNSFLEAMATGIPVIATKVGGIVDFLTHEETGLFCEVKNPESVAKQAMRLFEDNILREKIITKACNRVLKSYNWDEIIKLFNNDIFKNI